MKCPNPWPTSNSWHPWHHWMFAAHLETLHSLAKRHDLSRNLIRIWVQKYETGAFDEDAIAAELVEAYEARIAALERLVGKQALELEFLKGALKHTPRPRSATTSVVTGPLVSPSLKDAG